jgi:predicted RNase H-like nuclease
VLVAPHISVLNRTGKRLIERDMRQYSGDYSAVLYSDNEIKNEKTPIKSPPAPSQ